MKKAQWTENLTALTQLYLHDPEVKRWVDTVEAKPNIAFQWSARALPLKVIEAAGDLADLLVEKDPITFGAGRHYKRVIYTFYPSEFLLGFGDEILAAARYAQT